ncbi:MAG: N-acetyltransferase [Chloroflexi bacterium]|nr:N-acetyltransferase [Chloroflexota bacterium]
MREKTKSATEVKENSAIVRLGKKAVVDPGVILGYPTARSVDLVLIIGSGAHVRSGSVIYAGSRIGHSLETGHNVIIREENIIGDNFRVWSNSTIDYGCTIGNNVKVHHHVYVCQFTIIEDDVFIGPGTNIANDIHPGCPDALECMQGPRIKRGAQIGINCTLLPRVTIGEHSVIGAGSVVTRDIPAGVVAYGNPAQVICKIEDMSCTTGLRDKPYSHLIGRIEDAYTIG